MDDALSLLTTAEAGRICDPPLTPAGVRRVADLGRLRVAARTPSGQRLFERSDVEEFATRRRPQQKRGLGAAAVELQAEAALDFVARGGSAERWFESKAFLPGDADRIRKVIAKAIGRRRP